MRHHVLFLKLAAASRMGRKRKAMLNTALFSAGFASGCWMLSAAVTALARWI